MKILLFGKNGQLGWEICRLLEALPSSSGLELCCALDYPEVDFSQPRDLRAVLTQWKAAEVVINAAAYTAVDKAESEPDLARAVNRDAPQLIAKEAKRTAAFFIHYSTDYVFDGSKSTPYIESDEPHPINTYGLSKWEGEQVVQAVDGNYLILRTSWVYSRRGDTFVNKVLRWARTQSLLKVVDDQISNPTNARALAKATLTLLHMAAQKGLDWLRERKGLYHLAGSGFASRYDWALEILKHDPQKEEHLVQQVQRAKTADFPTPAMRPLFSALSCSRFHETFGYELPAWQESLIEALTSE